MTQPQSGVLAEQSTHATFLTLMLAPGETGKVKRTLAALPAMTEEVAAPWRRAAAERAGRGFRGLGIGSFHRLGRPS